MHGASVGESLSALTLCSLLASSNPSLRFVITSGTVSGASVISDRVAAQPIKHSAVIGTVQAPIDMLFCVRGFLNTWRPDALVCLESELWPNTLWECHRRGMPLLLVDGRMSPRSAARWSCPILRGFVNKTLKCFSLVLCQSERDAARFLGLGANSAECVGSVKAASLPLPVGPELVDSLRCSLMGRIVWVAVSTHDGEEEAVLRAHASLLSVWADECPPLLAIVPRHPYRGQKVLDCVRREIASGDVQILDSAEEQIRRGACVVIAAHMGATGPWMTISDVCFVGGSLVRGVGGHNVLEPALLGCAVLHGPHVDNSEHMITAMRAANADSLLCVHDSKELADAVSRLCTGGKERVARAEAARGAAEEMGVRARVELVARVGGVLATLL